jgi:hypothetical protein
VRREIFKILRNWAIAVRKLNCKDLHLAPIRKFEFEIRVLVFCVDLVVRRRDQRRIARVIIQSF